MAGRKGRISIVEVTADQLQPNPWNPNRMNEMTEVKLKANLEREGFVEPLVVRMVKSKYQILGGYHRWKIAQELGYETVPCVVVRLNDRRARVLSINLNELRGETVPHLLADLVHDLNREESLEDLATQLPYELADLEDLTDLLRIPDGLDLQLEEEAVAAERERVKVLSFPLRPDQLETVQGALEEATARIDSKSRSAALTHVAKTFREGEER